MTIKEIAGLCGAETHTIRNWVNKKDFLKENFTLRNSILEKLSHGSPENPSDYNLEETIAIIGEGGKNKTLAALLAENAANKDKLAARTMGSDEFVKEISGLIALNKKILAQMENSKQLPSPQDAAYGELAQFVIDNLAITGDKYDHVYVESLYESYQRQVNHVLSKRVFMYKICLDNPQINVKKVGKSTWSELTGCSERKPKWP